VQFGEKDVQFRWQETPNSLYFSLLAGYLGGERLARDCALDRSIRVLFAGFKCPGGVRYGGNELQDVVLQLLHRNVRSRVNVHRLRVRETSRSP